MTWKRSATVIWTTKLIGPIGIGFILAVAPPAGAQQAEPVSATSQASSPPQVPKPAPLPFPNRANQVLPTWLRVRGEFRDRTEGVRGSGFVSERNDLYTLNRFRFDATIRPSRLLAFQVQAQDARVQKKEIGAVTGAPFRDTFDLRMAYADIGDTQKGRVSFRVGRQELVYGEQRLVGHLGWANTARTFDVGKVTFRGKGYQIDAFGGSVVRILDGEFDKSGNGNRFLGVYGSTTAVVPQSTVEPYLFFRMDRGIKAELGGLGDLKAATVGARWVGKLPARLDYGVEMAAQTGSMGPDDVKAWAGHWQLRDTLWPRYTLRVVGEYNYASGDSNASDGTRGTFDQLYPTGHDKYGLADQVGWKNIHDLRSGIDVTPLKGFTLSANYHSWWLADTHDGLYSAGGALLARVAGGALSSHVGQELDAQASKALTPQIQLAGGYAHIFPGAFLAQATPGASYSFPYVMVTYVFLAEK